MRVSVDFMSEFRFLEIDVGKKKPYILHYHCEGSLLSPEHAIYQLNLACIIRANDASEVTVKVRGCYLMVHTSDYFINIHTFRSSF